MKFYGFKSIRKNNVGLTFLTTNCVLSLQKIIAYMSSDKKPDQIVFNAETQRYDAALKPYATNVGAPSIQVTDNSTWKNRNINKANKQIQSKYLELKAEYEKMMSELEYIIHVTILNLLLVKPITSIAIKIINRFYQSLLLLTAILITSEVLN